ncbi:MAG: O-antigen ligase family protein [Lysobacterales bacterium]
MLRALFAVLVVYTVYALHFPLETGIPSVNVTNLLFLVILVLIASRHEVGLVPAPAYLKMPLLLYFCVVTLAFVNAQMNSPRVPLDDFSYLKNAIFYPLFYFLALRCRLGLKQTRQMIILILVVAAVASVQAIRQGLDYGIGNFNETHRASGPFGVDFHMANRAGVYYAMFVPLFAAVALAFRGQRLWRLTAISGVALTGFAVMVTYSRQSYGIALLGLSLVFLRRSFLLSLALFGSMLVLVNYLPDSVTERVAETEQRGAHGNVEVDVSTASRWEIWQGGMQMFADHPFGVGHGRFEDNIGRYVPRFAHYDAHNFYVLTLCECGALGAVVLLWLVLRIFTFSWWLKRRAPSGDSEAQGLALGFSAMVLCMALGNLYGSPFSEGSVMGDFWILCGLLERYMALKNAAATNEPVTSSSPIVPMAERFPLAARAANRLPMPPRISSRSHER